jgi:hypothetical protein
LGKLYWGTRQDVCAVINGTTSVGGFLTIKNYSEPNDWVVSVAYDPDDENCIFRKKVVNGDEMLPFPIGSDFAGFEAQVNLILNVLSTTDKPWWKKIINGLIEKINKI